MSDCLAYAIIARSLAEKSNAAISSEASQRVRSSKPDSTSSQPAVRDCNPLLIIQCHVTIAPAGKRETIKLLALHDEAVMALGRSGAPLIIAR